MKTRMEYVSKWVGMTKSGSILCVGNPNEGLDYNLCSCAWLFQIGGKVLPYATNKKTMTWICRDWNKQVRANAKKKSLKREFYRESFVYPRKAQFSVQWEEE